MVVLRKKLVSCLVFILLSMLSVQAQPLVIIHTNDTHSQIDPYTYKSDVNVGGVLRREAAIREIRAENPTRCCSMPGISRKERPISISSRAMWRYG